MKEPIFRGHIVALAGICLVSAALLAQEHDHSLLLQHFEPPAVLKPEVTFLAEAPIIDGSLDQGLERLPVREFSLLRKSHKDNPVVPVSYRLAYGTHFFYVFIEVETTQLQFRDRAYQNGDGFHMMLGIPREGDAPTDEFYVLACSAVNNPRMEWSRRIFWYYNIDNIFVKTSADTKMEFKSANGKSGFELLLPWKDVHPYHPFVSEGIGFNLAYVSAVGEGEKNLHQVMGRVGSIQTENSTRTYARLTFESPDLSNGLQAFAQLESNHITVGTVPKIRVAAVAASTSDLGMEVQFRTAENTSVALHRQTAEVGAGVSVFDFPFDAAGGLPVGGYNFEWNSRPGEDRGEDSLTILPRFDFPRFYADLSEVQDDVPASTLQTLEFLAREVEQQLKDVKPYETCAQQRIQLAQLLDALDQAQALEDPYRNRRGYVRKAYRSKLDGSLQPYIVKVPNDYDPSKSYPLVVYLHGSATKENDIVRHDFAIPDGFIGLGPKGRGFSNFFHFDNAQVDIAEALEAVLTSYSVDQDRIILAGFSMGGYGVYRTFAEAPEKFRAIASFSGTPGSAEFEEEGIPNMGTEEKATLFANTRLFVFHGRKDGNVPFSITEQFVLRLKELGGDVEFHPDPDRGHEAPSQKTIDAYSNWLRRVVQ